MSELRQILLDGKEQPALDVDAVLGYLDAIGRLVAEVRSLVVAHQTPSVGDDGACRHPVADRLEAGTFAQMQVFCGKCGESL